MAIYHLKVQMISRSKGRTAVAAAAYRSASVLRDERQGLVFDYTKKEGVAHSKILAPTHVPDWIYDRERLWNAAELAETRVNSQIAREIDLAIPIELTKAQSIRLVEEFAQREFVQLGMIADVNVHLDHDQNPHAHILLTTREIGEEGFTVKNRTWNDKEKLLTWRRSWAELANEHLRSAGYEATIDHRSYREQGIELIPTKHLGPLLSNALEHDRAEEYQRLVEYKKTAEVNGNRIIADPEIALDALTTQQAVFSETDIYKFANRNSIDAEQFQNIVTAIKSQAIELAQTEQGKMLYTSRDMVMLEAELIQNALDISKSKQHTVLDKYRDQALSGAWFKKIFAKTPKLNSGQSKALEHILEEGGLKVVIGFAGTGKSTLMSIAQKAWEGQGYRVLGTALSGIAAQNLQESGIQSHTIDSLLLALESNSLNLNARDILVLDEAGMVNTQKLAELIHVAKIAQAKIVMLGDPEQLQPIQAGAPFRAIAERTGYVELNEIVRQNDPFDQNRTAIMRQATQEFATEHTREAIDRYKKLGNVYEHKTRFDALDAIINAWSNARQNSIMLAYTKKDVVLLNERARDILRKEKVLQHEQNLTIKNRAGELLLKPFAVNERIYFIRNDNILGVKNGSLGNISSINHDLITVLLDTGQTIAFNLDNYNSVDYGYAATIYKAQGVTVDRTYFLADKYLDRHATYVAATRHRHHLEIHYDRETFKYSQELYHILGRERTKDMVVDYADVRDLPNLLEEKTNYIHCDKSLEKMLVQYLDRQIELDRLMVSKAKDQTKIQSLTKELSEYADKLLLHPQIKEFTQTKSKATLYDRGGAEKIKERLRSKQLTTQDILAISREIYLYQPRSHNLTWSREKLVGKEQGIEY